MKFYVLSRFAKPTISEQPCVCLNWDEWNDYNYFTAFHLHYFDEDQTDHNIGAIKIAFRGQEKSERAKFQTGEFFEQIDPNYFSIGASDEYYENLNKFAEEIRIEILTGLNDVAFDLNLLNQIAEEQVFKVSFLRNYEFDTIIEQLHNIALGGARLTEFSFIYTYPSVVVTNPTLTFQVVPFVLPPSNLHVVIGRNGVGKTHLLRNLRRSFFENNYEYGNLEFVSIDQEPKSFINLVDVSYSMFDEVTEINSLHENYYRVGNQKERKYKIGEDYTKDDFLISVSNINSESNKLKRLRNCIDILSSDQIFKSSELYDTLKDSKKNYLRLKETYNKLSSGHKIILDVIVKLVDKVGEKTLLIMDEPETHLHPPLLSSFVRALSYLLIDRNGVGIIATHSPVILQEVPKDCVWKLQRSGAEIKAERLEVETFGTNIDVLTREIFGLEVTDSGFHNILKKVAIESRNYDEAILKFNNELGADGRAILRTLFRKKSNG